jgi:NADH-quinone oxidoreductase subunit G
MSNTINITINNKKIACRSGDKLIDVADDNGIKIPRFCYHKKLTTVASCRMCLVEIENSPKLMPSCATFVVENMVVHTNSDRVKESQRAVLEFLLLNHPLDCPVCDQGGDCVLQDNAFGFGNNNSDFSDEKIVNLSSQIGSLIATDFNRCISCTRCVRFGEEIAGKRELGYIGRANKAEISTYIDKTVDSELSGNIIDLCPVGSLTDKPALYKSRPWELVKKATAMPFDSLGSAAFLQIKNNKIISVIAKENKDINECWLSDRDRFGFLGYNVERLSNPKIKQDESWHNVLWNDVLDTIATKIKKTDNHNIAALISAHSSNEELYLLSNIMEQLGCNNIDYRLLQKDFEEHDNNNANYLGTNDLSKIEEADNILHVCSNLKKDLPMLNYRVFKAYKSGAKISSLSNRRYEFNYNLTDNLVIKPSQTMHELKAILKELLKLSPQENDYKLDDIQTNENHKNIASNLLKSNKSFIIFGMQAKLLDDYTKIKYMCFLLSTISKSKFLIVPAYANEVGADMLIKRKNISLNTQQILNSKTDILILYNFDDTYDISNELLTKSMLSSKFVIVISSFKNNSYQKYADVLLPLASVFESHGSMVNAMGNTQKYQQNIQPYKSSQEGWRVLLTLAEKLKLDNIKYKDVTQIQKAIANKKNKVTLSNAMKDICIKDTKKNTKEFEIINEFCIYHTHPIVRRSAPLHKTKDAKNSNYVTCSLQDREQIQNEDDKKISIKEENSNKQIITNARFCGSMLKSCVFIPLNEKFSKINNSSTAEILKIND